jgi:hypothetical protein
MAFINDALLVPTNFGARSTLLSVFSTIDMTARADDITPDLS